MDHTSGGATTPRPSPSSAARGRRLTDRSFGGLLAALVIFGGGALGLASLGGWVGIGAVFCLAALMVAALVIASDA